MKYFKTITLLNTITLGIAVILSAACRKTEPCSGITEGIVVKIPRTKDILKDEDRIWDLNIYIFDGYDSPVMRKFIRYDRGTGADIPVEVKLLKGCTYSFYVIANTGFDMGVMSTGQLEEWRLYISRPEGNIRGMPMSCRCSRTADGGIMEIPLKRLMCKISLKTDLSGLDSGIRFSPAVARIGNCPRCVQAFAPEEKGSAIESGDDCFITGYSCDWISSTTLYCLENRAEGELSSYVEIEIDYQSDRYESHDKGLIYRFHIGDDDTGQAAVRSCHYHITVKPQGDGLGNGDSDKNDPWRIDTSYIYRR